MNYLISYDISSNRLRERAAKLLKRQGCVRVQKSVFFGNGFPPVAIQALKQALRQLLEAEEGEEADSVLIVRIEKDFLSEVSLIGANLNLAEALKTRHVVYL